MNKKEKVVIARITDLERKIVDRLRENGINISALVRKMLSDKDKEI